MAKRLPTLLAGLLLAGSMSPAAHAEPAPDVDALIRTGSLELARREFAKAAEVFNEALAAEADHTVALEGLGHSLAGLGIAAKSHEDAGDAEAAVTLLRRSLALNPGGTERLDTLHARAEEALARLDPQGATAPEPAVPPPAEEIAAADGAEPAPALPPAPPPARTEADDDEIVYLPGAAAAGAAAATAGGVGAVAAAATPDAPSMPAPGVTVPSDSDAASTEAEAPTPTEDDGSWELAEYPQAEFDALLDDGARALRRGEYPLALEHFNVARMVRPDDGEARVAYRETIGAISDRVQTLIGQGSRDDARDVLRSARQAAPDDATLETLDERLFGDEPGVGLEADPEIPPEPDPEP